MTRWIRQYRPAGVVQASVYQRRRVPSKYGSQDIALLAAVDSAHGWVSGPGTLRVLKREHEQFGKSAFACFPDSGFSFRQWLRIREPLQPHPGQRLV